jgi:hypothetical protein
MDKRDWGGVLTFKCPKCGGGGYGHLDIEHVGSAPVACQVCTSGTIGIELKPEVGALVVMDDCWELIRPAHFGDYGEGYMYRAEATPILPARATLEAAKLSVWDGACLVTHAYDPEMPDRDGDYRYLFINQDGSAYLPGDDPDLADSVAGCLEVVKNGDEFWVRSTMSFHDDQTAMIVERALHYRKAMLEWAGVK